MEGLLAVVVLLYCQCCPTAEHLGFAIYQSDSSCLADAPKRGLAVHVGDDIQQ